MIFLFIILEAIFLLRKFDCKFFESIFSPIIFVCELQNLLKNDASCMLAGEDIEPSVFVFMLFAVEFADVSSLVPNIELRLLALRLKFI